jgi:sulfite reductase (NADPH) hemoprotein beta-component
VPEVIERLIHVYLRERIEAERFIDTVRRIGHAPFKDHVYATGFIAQDEETADKHIVTPAQYGVPYYSPRF